MAAEIRLGTSAFTAAGWPGAFYPKGMKSADYLSYYSTRFDTVEVDSTFYRCPTMEAVNNWALQTPPRFHAWMPRAEELFERVDPITADFAYIRWLGDRKEIEKLTRVWSRTESNREITERKRAALAR